ncbi:hypothetical protein Scep_017509 [Stephania cephalantha]|uniref:SHSP domain-containing protein n=1 Tax=Stephania cephalantha TaxID=152367 RepID=A0AAP0IRH0_9MAGN
MERARSHSTTFKEPQPSPYWISYPSSHALFVDVPGFKREDLMVAIKKPRKVLVSGARPVSGNKTSHFMHEFDAPEDSEISQSHKDWISESDHEKDLYGPNKKREWERNITMKDHDLPENKNSRREQKHEHELDHDLQKKEEERGIEFELGPDQDLMFRKEEDQEKERDQITEGNELELDRIIGGDLGIDQSLLQHKEEEEKEGDQMVEDQSEQINDDLIQKEMEEEERGRNLLIEAREHGHDIHMEEGMRFIKIEGLGSIHAPGEDETQKEGVLIERIASVDDLREGRRRKKKKKNEMDVEQTSEGRQLRYDLSEEKGAKRNGNGKAEEEHTDSGSTVETPMKEETKTTRDKKTVIVMALVALSIGFYWSHKILSNRVTESLK